jgi:hypothetical protein
VPEEGWELNPYASLQAGWHLAALHTPGLARPAFAERAATAVARAGAGLRLSWGLAGWRCGLAAGLEHVQPLRSAGVDYFQPTGPAEWQEGTIHLAQPGQEIVIRWFGHLGW